MASLSPNAKQAFLNAVGQPAAGYLLYTYQTGTSTPLVSYSDKAGTVANANPITLDARGEAIIYLLSQQYRYVLKDSLGSTVWTRDNVSPSADSSDLKSTGDTVGGALVGFIQKGTGAVPRTLQDKAREQITPEDYGAKGDGTTDDTAAIQSAINYVQALPLGGTVVFTAAQYIFTTLSITANNIKLYSKNQSRLIKTTTSGNGIVVGNQAGRVYTTFLDGLLLGQGVANGTFGAMIYANNVGDMVIKDCQCINYPFSPFRGIELVNASDTTITSYASQNCINDGFHASDCIDIRIVGGRSDSNGACGWVLDTCSGIYASCATAFHNAVSGWLIQKTVVSPVNVQSGSSFLFFSSCVGDSSGGSNWDISNTINITLNGCWGASQSNPAVSDKHGFVINTCTGVDMTGCIALTNTSCGVIVLTSTDVTITGGQYQRNSVAGTSLFKAGIQINSGCTVTLNGVNSSDRGASPTQNYGLSIGAGVTRLKVLGCTLAPNVNGPTNFGGIPGAFSESDNYTNDGLTIASANIVTLPNFGKRFTISGTTTINGLSNQWEGREVTLVFNGTATVAAAGSLKLVSNFSATSDDALTLVSDGTNWYEKSRSVNI